MQLEKQKRNKKKKKIIGGRSSWGGALIYWRARESHTVVRRASMRNREVEEDSGWALWRAELTEEDRLRLKFFLYENKANIKSGRGWNGVVGEGVEWRDKSMVEVELRLRLWEVEEPKKKEWMTMRQRMGNERKSISLPLEDTPVGERCLTRKRRISSKREGRAYLSNQEGSIAFFFKKKNLIF